MRWLLLLCLGVLACRDLPDGRERLFEEGFEQTCDGTPCGWSQIAGPEGGASWVTTIHDGEHGMRLSGEGTTIRSPMGAVRNSALQFGTVESVLSVRCDEGTALSVEAGIRDAATGNSDTFRGRALPPSEWGSATVIELVSDRALVDGGLSGGMFGGSIDIQIDALSIRVTGGGACEIDHLVIDDVGQAVGPRPDPDEGC